MFSMNTKDWSHDLTSLGAQGEGTCREQVFPGEPHIS